MIERVNYLCDSINGSIEYLDAPDYGIDYAMAALVEDFYTRKISPKSELTEYLENQVIGQPTLHYLALSEYHKHPLNEEGFRSISFDFKDTSRTSILLIGDSFTWGLNARPKTNSFSDRLLARGYVVYNAGIIGTDPAQYLTVARKYIPLLKPDFVVVNYYEGNDQMFTIRESVSEHPANYTTTAGWFPGYVNGHQLSYKQAIEFVDQEYRVPAEQGFLISLLSKTCIGTSLLRAAKDHEVIEWTTRSNQPEWGGLEGTNLAGYYLGEIDSLAIVHGSKSYSLGIPLSTRIMNGELQTVEFQNSLQNDLADLEVYFSSELTEECFSAEDGHFNSMGMKVWADMIQCLIETGSEGCQFSASKRNR